MNRVKKTLLLCLVAVLSDVCLSAAMASPRYTGRLGVEAADDAFVDIVKQNYRWEKPDSQGSWTKLLPGDVDKQGWPKSDCRWVMDSRPCAEWAGQIDDPEAYRVDRSGTYKGSFLGEARLVQVDGPFSILHQKYDAAVNRTLFDLVISKPGPNHGLVVLDFRDTQRSSTSLTNTGISDFRLIRPGYPADTTQVFTKEYLACLTHAAFSTIRFMAVLGINGNIEWGKDHTRTQSWNNRKLPTDASVENIEPLNKKDGWPWEYTIQLCNQADMDMWINIPVSVDDDYIRNLATLIKATLKPNLNVYLEHGNEMWNFGFLQYSWNKARAKEEVQEGNSQYNYDQTNNEEIWAQRRHAQKVKNIIDIFASVFGKESVNHRIRGVLAGTTPDPNGFFIVGRLPGMLDYLQAIDGDPGDYIYAISMAAYYGGNGASGEVGTADYTVDQVLGNMRVAIDHARSDRVAMVALARRFALPGGFVAYESGPDIGGGSTVNSANRIRAIRDPRQAMLYQHNFADCFWDLGGNLAMQFTLSGAYSRYGAWGLTDDLSKPDRNSLFPEVRQLIGGERTAAVK
ncbi:MAG: hypothetical protein ABSE48_16565 [Verrucomicrobiota bacterium]